MERKFAIFALFYFVFAGKFQVQAPRGAYIRRGDLTEGFCVTILGGLYLEGLIHGGAYFRKFTVIIDELTQGKVERRQADGECKKKNHKHNKVNMVC